MRAPDLSSRPFSCSVERDMRATADQVYEAWTEKFDSWFAQPGTLNMTADVGALFFFETQFENSRHPHYGRFLALTPGRLIEHPWVTGNPGTGGAETIVRVELEPREDGSLFRLTHSGFYDEDTASGHGEAWQQIAAMLDQKLTGAH